VAEWAFPLLWPELQPVSGQTHFHRRVRGGIDGPVASYGNVFEACLASGPRVIEISAVHQDG
jgi:hypothetical protein